MNGIPFCRRTHFSGRRWIGVALFPLLVLGAWVVYLLGTHNFHPIIDGEAYRSGQMDSNDLAHCLERYGIRSVINLRGQQCNEAWYREEIETTRALGVVHRDLALSSRKLVSSTKANELVALFNAVPKPVLIHCDGGADRTAFAAALYGAEVAKQPRQTAEHEFSAWYGYLPFVWKQKARLRESFRAYMENRS